MQESKNSVGSKVPWKHVDLGPTRAIVFSYVFILIEDALNTRHWSGFKGCDDESDILSELPTFLSSGGDRCKEERQEEMVLGRRSHTIKKYVTRYRSRDGEEQLRGYLCLETMLCCFVQTPPLFPFMEPKPLYSL